MNQHAEKIMDLIKQYNKDSDSSTSSDEKITQPNATSEKKYLEILNNDIGKIKKKKQREKLRLQFSSTLLKDIEKQIHACLGKLIYFRHFDNVRANFIIIISFYRKY